MSSAVGGYEWLRSAITRLPETERCAPLLFMIEAVRPVAHRYVALSEHAALLSVFDEALASCWAALIDGDGAVSRDGESLAALCPLQPTEETAAAAFHAASRTSRAALAELSVGALEMPADRIALLCNQIVHELGEAFHPIWTRPVVMTPRELERFRTSPAQVVLRDILAQIIEHMVAAAPMSGDSEAVQRFRTIARATAAMLDEAVPMDFGSETSTQS